MKNKICHIIFSMNTGGAEIMLVDILNTQIKSTPVTLIVVNNSYNTTLLSKINKKVTIVFINRSKGSKNPYPVFKLNFLLLKNQFDVVHCHNHNIAPLIFPFLKKKLVLTVHDVGISDKYFRRYHKLFAISKIVKDDIFNRSGLHAILIYNGICAQLVQKKSKYENYENFRILMISRLVHEKKGQHIVIEAIKLLKNKGNNNVILDIIGEGPSESFLKKMIKKYHLGNQINMIGAQDRDFIYKHIKDYELLVQPSLFEGFGLTVAEGMAAKVPVLVSNIEGPMEIIENGKYGFYFEKENAENLAFQIEKIIKTYNKEGSRLKIVKAFDRVTREFDIKNTATNYLKNY